MTIPRPLVRAATLVALTGVYVLAGKLGLSFAAAHPNATAVWPPTGIALAAFLLLGNWIWPAIFAGAFLVNATTPGTQLAPSAGIAFGNTLEGWVGAMLIHRFAGGAQVFDRAGRIFRFALFAGLCTAVSATIGVTSLVAGNMASLDQFGRIWFTWWLGDLTGALVLCPLLVLAPDPDDVEWNERRALEAIALVVILAAIGTVVFGGALFADRNMPLGFLCLPPLVWAAFRFGRRETAAALVVLCAIAISGTLRGLGPFVRDNLEGALLLLQSFMGVMAVTALAISATVVQRRRADEGLRRLNDQLEVRVADATAQHRAANEELRRQIAARERIDRNLQSSEARLLEAQRIAHIGSWEWDVRTNALWWSDELYRIYGHTPGALELGYEQFMDAVHPEDREHVDRIVRQAFQDGQPFAFEHRIVRPGGDVRILYAEGRVIRDAGGEVVRMLGVGQDVTERKRAEEQRAHLLMEQTARREAEDANRRKDEFLAMLSHELRTPLSAITGWCHLLRDGRIDADTMRRAVETIDRNARVQDRLISDILDISRLDSGKLELRKRPLAVVEVVEAALDTVRPQAIQKRLAFHERLDRTAPRVLGDADRLQQVVWNLLANAVKFSPEEGSIDVELRRVPGGVEFEVMDSGTGIDPEFLPYVFDAFTQDDTSSTRRHGGLGLGLAIARRIVELHGGTIAAANRADRSGARLTVNLPALDGDSDFPVREASSATDLRGPRLDGVRVLIVDDEADAREVLAEALAGRGADVVTCASSADALQTLRRREFDVVMSDIAMPGEDGYAFITQVRADPVIAHVPAIALTAYASRDDVERTRRAGYQLHLAKPMDTARIASALATLAGLPRTERREVR